MAQLHVRTSPGNGVRWNHCEEPHTLNISSLGATITCPQHVQWFTKAGFTDVKIKRIGPSWYRGVRRHGLIMGCSVTGVKPKVRGDESRGSLGVPVTSAGRGVLLAYT